MDPMELQLVKPGAFPGFGVYIAYAMKSSRAIAPIILALIEFYAIIALNPFTIYREFEFKRKIRS